MEFLSYPEVDPWRLEIITVRDHSHTGAERRSVSRDLQRGLLVRLRQGAYVERAAFESLTPEQQHIVRMRALAAMSAAPVVFSHWSAAVLHGVPVDRRRLGTVHTTVDSAGARTAGGVTAHLFRTTRQEVVVVREVLATDVPRTVIDIAGSAPFEEGVMAADQALGAGVARSALEAAIDLAGPRRAARRPGEVVAFAHPGADSAAESRGRVTMFRLGVEVPRLQHRMVLDSGVVVFLDYLFRSVDVGAEADGDVKYLDPTMAPQGAGRAVLAEKQREDMVRARLRGLARFGWLQSGSASLLRPVLARAGVVALRCRPTLADYAAEARSAEPRRAGFVPLRPAR